MVPAFIASIPFIWVAIITVIAVIILAITVFEESYGWFTILGAALLAFLHGTEYSPISFILENWVAALGYLGAYLAIGLGWLVIASLLHLRKLAIKYEAARTRYLPDFLENEQVTQLTPDLHDSFRRFIESKTGLAINNNKLALSRGAMVAQVVFWPFKMVGFFLGDAVRLIVDLFVNSFGKVFLSIQRAMFRRFPELNG